MPRHLLNPTDGTEKKRGPGRPPKERKSADEYQSAIACHLAADALCRARYSELDFRILARARSEQHLKVLEALYIQSLKPVLCRQKQFITDLKLFHRPRTWFCHVLPPLPSHACTTYLIHLKLSTNSTNSSNVFLCT